MVDPMDGTKGLLSECGKGKTVRTLSTVDNVRVISSQRLTPRGFSSKKGLALKEPVWAT